MTNKNHPHFCLPKNELMTEMMSFPVDGLEARSGLFHSLVSRRANPVDFAVLLILYFVSEIASNTLLLKLVEFLQIIRGQE